MKKLSFYFVTTLCTFLFLFSSCDSDDGDVAPETIVIRDTVKIIETITETDTVTITVTEIKTITETDTVTITETDTVTVSIIDTVTISITDTVIVSTTDTITVVIDSNSPSGATTTISGGEFISDAVPTTGSASIIEDAAGNYFLALSNDFTTNQGTGTVSVFLATSNTFSTEIPNGSQIVIGAIKEDGAAYFKLDNKPLSKFTHVILWCSTVGLQFANTELK